MNQGLEAETGSISPRLPTRPAALEQEGITGMARAKILWKPKTEERPTVHTRGTDSGATANPGKGRVVSTLSQEDIAARAYALFLARGGQPGDELWDWF